MTDITRNRYDLLRPPKSPTNSQQSVESSAAGSSSIVQYHTKGEFQPVVPIVSSGQEYQPEETESEIFQPTADAQLLERTSDIPKEVEEAYIPSVETNLDAGRESEAQPQVQYSAWDASRSVSRIVGEMGVLIMKQSPSARGLLARGLEFPSDSL